jgi:LmbE family N-acetylglucosaminyl deacetylase
MKKIIFGIFAHPDDEAFGPAGALLLETRAGTELHLVTLTNGDAGVNPDGHADLGAVRLEEWHQAGQLLGAKTMDYFGYKDGQLTNADMIKIGQQLIDLVTPVLEAASSNTAVDFMTLDLNGMTGHIDHIVAARAAYYAFYTLKKDDPRLGHIFFSCVPNKYFPHVNTDWIFMEAGRSPAEIDTTIDARSLKDDIITIMRTHTTQRGDGETHIAQQGDELGLNYFIVKE